ncbi:MAG: LPP20 family lipoprotein [Gammaproteobacteria bacterium]|nr:LPP20 family lipoprotein [Gammaproteobacteria bacterium]
MRQVWPLLLIVALVSGCGGTNTRQGPDWLDGSSKKYSSRLYIIGTAQAYNLEGARDRARAEVAKVFEVAIEEQSRDNLTFISDASGEKLTQRIARDTSARTQKVLHGVEIVDTWHDKKQGQFYAMAVLHRGRTTNALRQQLEQLDQSTRVHINSARTVNDKLAKLSHAQAAFTLQMQRAGIQRSLQVVDSSGRGVKPRWNLAQLSTDFRQQMEQVKLQVNVADQPAGFKQRVDGVLGKSGFQVKPGQRADFILSARLELGKVSRREGWYWINGRMEILLTTPQGQVRGSQRWPIQVSATEKATASRRAMDKAVNVLQNELRNTLLGFAE